MKKTVLLLVAILICCGLKSKAQWVESGSLKNINWEYCFAAPAPPASNTRSGDNLTITSTPTISDFLSSPTSGKVGIMTTAAEVGIGRSSFTLNGACANETEEATDNLVMVSTSGTANPATLAPSKFLAYEFKDASKVMSMHFNITLNSTAENISSTWYIFIGAVNGNNVFVTNSTTPGTGSGASPDARTFGSIRIQKLTKTGKYELAVRKARPLDGNVSYRFNLANHFTANVFETGVKAKVDIYCNNETAEKKYSHNGGTAVILPGRKMDIYVNDLKLGTYDQSAYTVSASANPAVHSAMAGQPIDGISIYSREAATSEVDVEGTPTIVEANSASIQISNLKVVHLATPTTMPVTLTDFGGKATNNGIALNWQTASEQNNSHFILNRSVNETDFSYLTRVEGNGTTNAVKNYSYIDKSPSAGTNYYQLVQVDNDGKENTHEKLLAVGYGVGEEVFSVSQLSNNNLKIEVSSAVTESAELFITDISGKVIYKTKRLLNAGSNNLELVIPKTGTGVYVAKLVSASQSRNVKFLL